MAHKTPGQTPSRCLTFFFGHGFSHDFWPATAYPLSVRQPIVHPHRFIAHPPEGVPARAIQGDRGL